jgi:hypothetical protein
VVLAEEGHIPNTADLGKTGANVQQPSPETLLNSLQTLQSDGVISNFECTEMQIITYERLDTRMYCLSEEGRSILREDVLPYKLAEAVLKKKSMSRNEIKVRGFFYQ